MERIPQGPVFLFPDVEKERGEIERVAGEVFGEKDARDFFQRFSDAARSATLEDLSEDMWRRLLNTDSHDIPLAGWSDVEACAVEGHADHPRDWQALRSSYEQGASIEAPIVMNAGGTLHLVAGNTRLMVARALGVTPKVLLVELDKRNL